MQNGSVVNAWTPPPAPPLALSTPILAKSELPPPPPPPPPRSVSASTNLLPPTLPTEAPSPADVLRQLLREWYCGVAELLIGEVAVADVLGYQNSPFLCACEQTEQTEQIEEAGDGDGVLPRVVSSPRLCAREAMALLHSLQSSVTGLHESPAERLMAQLTQLLPALRTDATASSSPHDPRQQTPVTPLPPDVRGESPSTEGVAAGAPTAYTTATTTSSLLCTAADALNAALDTFDSVVNRVFTSHYSEAPVASSSLSLPALPHLSEGTRTGGRDDDDDAGGASCIVAGLLLSRHVRLRRGPAYAAVTSPLLIVLDLDLTVLRQPLSTIAFRATQTMPLPALRALFVDVDFLRGFCAAVTRQGHALAICSLTEGTADQHRCDLSVAEVVVALLSAVLPPTRRYLISPDDVVCFPKTLASPGKLFHLQELQQRRNARDATPPAAVEGSGGWSSALRANRSVNDGASDTVTASIDFSSPDAEEAEEAAVPLLLPRWLSTDVVLIDDDRENCRLAVTQGYHAAHCAETGMTARWFADRPELQVLLGVTTGDISSQTSS